MRVVVVAGLWSPARLAVCCGGSSLGWSQPRSKATSKASIVAGALVPVCASRQRRDAWSLPRNKEQGQLSKLRVVWWRRGRRGRRGDEHGLPLPEAARTGNVGTKTPRTRDCTWKSQRRMVGQQGLSGNRAAIVVPDRSQVLGEGLQQNAGVMGAGGLNSRGCRRLR